MKLNFYNHYGNGDVFESREFVLGGCVWPAEPGRVCPPRFGIFADLPQIKLGAARRCPCARS
jgi:hypothetical protein